MAQAPALVTRRHGRIRTHLRVIYGTEAADREGTAESISEGGLHISTNEPFKVGTRLTLRLDFPEGTVCHQGEVVWAIRVPERQRDSMVCGMGICFIDPDPEWPALFRRWKAGSGPGVTPST